jgi:peroxiredoxin
MKEATIRGNGYDETPRKRTRMRRIFFSITGGLLALSVAVGIYVALGESQSASEGARGAFGGMPMEDAADSNPAVAALAKAARAVGFHSTMDSSVGQVEKLSADSAHPPGNPLLLPVGTPALAFSLQAPDGERVSLSDYKGKIVFLEFFATWCPQCQAEAQHIVAIRQASSARIEFLSVNADSEDAASVYAFHRYFALTYPALLDPGQAAGSFTSKGSAGPVTQAYQAHIYPTFYILDRDGKVAWRSDGEQPDALLLAELRRISKR